ncbi:DUF6048 family protein [Olleya aquimaris]|uniref:DUF3575 domain-containing protein n=1 Tax=Olleya aquimaris TaxID=639310 RepID=A0A327RRJ1_9FLAO|nr:DUF6048 family protein [Olleya aquimaris]RAJ16337.1 hypothetical protein LY08_01196 [Olleya aquimaris]
MKPLRTISFIISLFWCCNYNVHAQDTEVSNDTLKLRYGLRVGADVSKLIRTALDDEYSGFELNADYRLTKNWFIAGEIGTEEKTSTNEFLSVTASGSYFKAGFDYNMYDNWYGMDNMIFAGFRLGASTFSQTRNNYTVYNTNQYWQPQFSSTESTKASGLSALWFELMLGIKAEIIHNVYIGVNAQLKGMITQDQPVNFENLYVPGFYKTFDSGRIGVGYGYNISYLIPIFKKKTVKEEDSN